MHTHTKSCNSWKTGPIYQISSSYHI